MLWTLTTNADERNARARVWAYRPTWSEMEVHAWLAEHYPRPRVMALTCVTVFIFGALVVSLGHERKGRHFGTDPQAP